MSYRDYTMNSVQRLRNSLLYIAISVLAACSGSNSGDSGATTMLTVGGSVTGLVSGTSVELADNGNNATITANGSYSFMATFVSGASYDVTVAQQPAGANCAVTNGSGTVGTTNVANILISCTPNNYTISGALSGLLGGRSVTLQNNGGNSTTVAASGSFSFSSPVASGSTYAVTVSLQPPGQTCSVSNGGGTIAGVNISNVSVACSDNTYNIGVMVSGLSASGLVLQDNGGDNLTVSADASINFASPVASGSGYAVSVLSQPTGQTCTVSGGSGTVTSTNVTGIPVSCTINTYRIGGSVSGLSSSGLILQDNGGDDLTVSASGSFAFATPIAMGGAYAVTVLAQPAGQTCSVSNASGTVGPAEVSNIGVTCGNVWTWIGGSSTLNASGVYGTQGVASMSNVPGARLYAVSWIDLSGNLWLFGGMGIDVSGNPGVLNDLWEFNPAAGTWQWVNGSNAIDSNGVYGTQGVASTANIPPSRQRSVSWTDSSGNLWLFGGTATSTGNLNDLWKFDPTAGTWEWVSGSNATDAHGVYGTQGVASASNVPGARDWAVSWTDSSGNLWLFGGTGLSSSGTVGALNDLWKFDPRVGTWEWVNGSSTTVNAVGVYGTQGVASVSNVPGARAQAVQWTDASGNLWLFGGFGYTASSSGNLNDLWKFSPTAGTWEWVSGSNTAHATGIYGTQGVASTSNAPGGRGLSNTWTDASGNLWLFGGTGLAVSSDGELNDLWKFNTAAGTWEWVGGSNDISATGIYGTQGVASISNVPGARLSTVSWTDASGNLWLFGGEGWSSSPATDGLLNDLWKYTP
jgi:N-acetylneuraminic acid mutarotase